MSGIQAPTDSAPTAVPDAASQSAPIEEAAVYVRNGFKSYGMGKQRSTVLRNLAMNVKKGTM